ncbi:hypothetical protein PT974_08038 [Cladobotryum mycophilum]|uniref:Uncharacterized protein n=1 Tax=Cladobotryum mycophilum TaxID=491253 RepID=A0ABR0SD54_9HYPO
MFSGVTKGNGRIDDIETQITVAFVSDEAPKIHEGFGGSAKYNSETGHFEAPAPYRNLALSLQEYVPSNGLDMGVALGPNATEESWQALFVKINQAEDITHGESKSPMEIFKKMWYKIGDYNDVIDPWVSLIPDSYGLAVVKSAIAIILKLAQRSASARQRIFDAFKGIRNVIGNANSKRRSFQTDTEVSRCAADLYEVIVEAIEKILESLPAPKKPFRWNRLIPQRGKSGEQKKSKKEDPLDLPQVVQSSAENLERAVDSCRDIIIERTGQVTQDTNSQVTVITKWIITEADKNFEETKMKISKVQIEVEEVNKNVQGNVGLLQDIRNRQNTDHLFFRREASKTNRMEDKIEDISLLLMNNRQIASENLLELLMEERKKNTELKRQNKLLKHRKGQQLNFSTVPMPNAIITLERLYDIICQPTNGQMVAGSTTITVDSTLNTLDKDLERVIRLRAKLDLNSQGQAQSILRQDRFLTWMESHHPDHILVDGNVPAAARDSVSVMSLFCASFILSMSKMEPDSIMAHFFCGLHPSPRNPWCGPSGLVRLLIFQLLTALEDDNALSLEFLDRRSYARDLEDDNLERLCDVLRQLLHQFPPSKTVYCIIDGISLLDNNTSFGGLGQVLETLEDIVNDDELRPLFKLLMTVPGRSSLRLTRFVDMSHRISLSTRALNPRPLTGRWLDAALSPSSRQRSRSNSRASRDGSRSRHEDEDEDEDNTEMDEE